MDEIYLNRNMKIMIPFSIWISQTNVSKIKAELVARHEEKKSYIAPEFLGMRGWVEVEMEWKLLLMR